MHSFEESFYVVTGTAVIDTTEGSFRVAPRADTAWSRSPCPTGGATRVELPVRWAEMQAPGPAICLPGGHLRRAWPDPGQAPRQAQRAISMCATRATVTSGKITPSQMDPTQQSQDLLEVTASMRTALLVYGGINVKMMVDSDLGAQLSTMFMVQYDPDGATGPHDHPFEETYFFLEGRGRGDLRRQTGRPRRRRHRLGGCRVPALLPQPRRWAAPVAGDPGAAAAAALLLSVRSRLGLPTGGTWMTQSLLIVGGTHGIGKEIARHYAKQGWSVVLTGRDGSAAKSVATELGGDTRGIALDLSEPEQVADALADVGAVDHLVLAAIARDTNTLDNYDIASARNLVTMKLLGYTAVVSAMRDRLAEDGSIVLFGGRAKDRPYPGGMTVGTVNAGISGMMHGLWPCSCAPRRVNAIHPGIVADSSILVGEAGVHRKGPSGDADRPKRDDGGHRRRGRLPDSQPVGQRPRPVHRRRLAAAMRVALIGAGRMGSAMGGRVAAAGHDLMVFNRTRSRAEERRSAYRCTGG